MKLSFKLRNHRRGVLVPFAYLCLLLGASFAIAQSDELESVAPGALTSELSTRLLEIRLSINLVTEDGRIIMKMDRSEPTTPGRAVGAIMEQANQLRVEALFTAFWETETDLTLHAQGQVWVADTHGTYGATPVASAYRAVPVALGDRVLFFPLGAHEQAGEWDTRRFQFRTEPVTVSQQQNYDEAEDVQGNPVVIVMAIQIVPYDKSEAAGLPSRSS